MDVRYVRELDGKRVVDVCGLRKDEDEFMMKRLAMSLQRALMIAMLMRLRE